MLEIKNIDVYYGDLQALWNISIKVDAGEIVTIIGSNGAGKSTIMKTISGLIKPKKGSISFNNIRIEKLSVEGIVEMGICMVPEGRRLFPQMSVLENLEMGASIKAARKLMHSTIVWIYELFPVLKERAKQKAGTLSGGEQQMLAIGRALMSHPKLLMVDELSLGLSPLLSQELSRVIKDLNKSEQLTIFIVEQDINMALSIADRGYIIENGRIQDCGTTQQLLSSKRVKEAYLGISSSN